jgi:hypothetical protein
MSNGHTGEVQVKLYPYSTTTLGGVGGQRHAPAALPRERDTLPIETECTCKVKGKDHPRTGHDGPEGE